MKRLICIWMLLFLLGPVLSAAAETKVMAVTDIHYLAKPLYEGSGLFIQALKNGDGKITQYGDELLSALYREILSEQPDALLVTGDLSFNGEKQSHLRLAEWFSKVEASGVPVWVIPGNHDIGTRPIGYTSEGGYWTEGVTAEEFREIYRDFMMPGEAGCSYAAPAGENLRVLMTDVSFCPQTFGVFTGAHSAWLTEELRKAQEAGVRVITASHHNLAAHTDFSRDSFLMFGSEAMRALLARAGVPLHLSGHMHIQHIAEQDGVADAATGAFCIWPHRYASVTLTDQGKLRYEARELRDEFLPDGLKEESKAWFADIARTKSLAGLADVPEEDGRLMADLAARFNLAYFSGTVRDEYAAWQDDPAYRLWEAYGGQGFWSYMRLVMDETEETAKTGGSHLVWEEK